MDESKEVKEKVLYILESGWSQSVFNELIKSGFVEVDVVSGCGGTNNRWVF